MDGWMEEEKKSQKGKANRQQQLCTYIRIFLNTFLPACLPACLPLADDRMKQAGGLTEYCKDASDGGE